MHDTIASHVVGRAGNKISAIQTVPFEECEIVYMENSAAEATHPSRFCDHVLLFKAADNLCR